MVERSLRMREASGSIPDSSTTFWTNYPPTMERFEPRFFVQFIFHHFSQKVHIHVPLILLYRTAYLATG